jgi:hypothetical protein
MYSDSDSDGHDVSVQDDVTYEHRRKNSFFVAKGKRGSLDMFVFQPVFAFSCAFHNRAS